MKRLSWKYMAGLIDGEGCIDMQANVHKRDGVYYCRPRLRVTLSGESGKEMIDLMLANFGGTHDCRERTFSNPNWLPAYAWCLTAKTHLRAFLQNIVNHLILKKEQARFAIWWIDNVGGKQVTEEVRRLGTDELKAMKRDSHRLSERAAKNFIALMR
jgi:hypothetical protein